jgi:asparagine synthase (glutamine-hydrolysing)
VCGIIGYTHRNLKVPADRIERGTRLLQHRGPDQRGLYRSETISLGAARLQIVDLAHGDQPIFSDDRNTVIVFNGEIYNHIELRRELEQLGHQFRSCCDTEVVLRAFLEWNTSCFARLRGMFAIALWNERERRLVLARDRMGIKPLYIHRRGKELYFGSELKAILLHPEIERRIDQQGLSFFLSLNYVPGPHTLVKGIEKLPPGHWLEWRNGVERTETFWKLEMRPRPRSLESAKEELDHLLGESVREHMMSDVPLGIWTSGGIDSSTILHYASRFTSAQLKTFSISFRGRTFDESAYFREIAEMYGTDHCEFDLSPAEDLCGAIEELSYYSDEPSGDAGALPMWFLSAMSRKKVTVALSGEGADELFGGYYTYLADYYARALRRFPASVRQLALAAVSHWPVSDDKISFGYKLQRFLRGSLLSPDEAHCFWNGTFSESEKRKMFSGTGAARLTSLYARLSSTNGDYLNRYLCFDQLNYLPDDILYKCDRTSMAHSLEVRPPFLDHRIVEFAASLPVDLKVRGWNLKFLLKELMRDKLPASILQRKKEGFDIPVHDWMRSVLRPLLLDTLTREVVEATGILRWSAIEKLISDHLERRADVGYHLWGLMILFLWIKRWKIQWAAASEPPVERKSPELYLVARHS